MSTDVWKDHTENKSVISYIHYCNGCLETDNINFINILSLYLTMLRQWEERERLFVHIAGLIIFDCLSLLNFIIYHYYE